MNRLLKAAGQAAVATRRSELRIKRLEMLKDSPKQLLHHVTVAVLVGVRERVAAWWHRTTNRSKFCAMVAKAITDIVQPNRMGDLSKKKTHNMTPRSKSSGLLVHTVLLRKVCCQMRRDEFTKLMQCAAIVLGRRYVFHAADSLVSESGADQLFYPSLTKALNYILWDNCVIFLGIAIFHTNKNRL